MLSVAPAEVAPPTWQGAYAVDVVGQLNSGTVQILPINLSSDGGYISFDTIKSYWQQSHAADYVITRSNSISVSDLDSRGQLFSTTGGVTELNGFGSGSISQPEVVVYSAGGELSTATNSGLVLTPQGNTGGSSEGGAIPIHAVLAGVRAEVAAGRQHVNTSLARRNPVTTSPTRSDAALSAGGLSGELGRAVIFEFAGGEPVRDQRPGEGEGDSQLRVGNASAEGDGPLSMVKGRGGESTKSGDGERAAQGNRGSAAGQSQPNQVDPSRKQAAAGVGDVLGGNVALPIVQANWVHDQSDSAQDAMVAVANADEAEVSRLATAAAFDQFGDDEAARVESPAGTPWWRAWGAVPLLLALALERIASRRSRHPQTETPRMIIRTPSRWSGFGGGASE